MVPTAAVRRKLLADIQNSHEIQADILKRIRQGEDFDLISAWEKFDRLNQEIAVRLKKVVKQPK